MVDLLKGAKGDRILMMGNDALARGALEAGVDVVSGYPGTPSSEIIENLSRVSKQRGMYLEWSVNEKVATEVAAAGSFAGLRSMVVMKQVGVNVASDFLLHLSEYGTRGGMVLISCEDPGALSSTNEGESRPYAKMMEFPLIEPGDFQDAKDMVVYAFELSERIRNIVMIRSVTRLSHASGMVTLGDLPEKQSVARFTFTGTFFDQMDGPVVTVPGITDFLHSRQRDKLRVAATDFEAARFNNYQGSAEPEMLIIASSACYLYAREAIEILNLRDRVGLLKLGTTWPLPENLLAKYLSRTDTIMVVEEVQPFLEDNIKALVAELGEKVGFKTFIGKGNGDIPPVGEMNPDHVIKVLVDHFKMPQPSGSESYQKASEKIAADGAPTRALTFCPGCPHRASFWSIQTALKLDNRDGFVCGDIGCYTLAILPTGFNTLKTGHSMGSGLGVASGFGKLGQFGFDQPVIAVCGDSTFFHATIPALVNAVHNRSNLLLIVLDNGGTAMTGFQSHPGLPFDAQGDEAPAVDIQKICQAIGAETRVADPFEVTETQEILLQSFNEGNGVRVLILKQPCALSPGKKGNRERVVSVDHTVCKGDVCGCNRLCSRVFKCPALNWDTKSQTTRVDEALCVGCGVCAQICPVNAIEVVTR